ncbi:MAG: thioredoxin domain-containing protein [bacterium]|nr:thioredoxin domain-containing protein [bacterium]
MMGATSFPRFAVVLFITVGTVVLAIAVFMLVRRTPPRLDQSPRAAAPVLRGDEPSRGKANAEVVLVEFADFGCEACREEAGAVRELLTAFPDRVRVVWKDAPNERAHPGVLRTHHAGRCSQEQGKFWEFHDAVFARELVPVSDANLDAVAEEVMLDNERFRACMGSQAPRQRIQRDVSEALQLGLTATPTFFIGSERFERVPSRKIIEQL